MAYLVLVRHGISDYNKKGLWAGWMDVPLIDEGRDEAKKTADELKNIHFNVGFTSVLQRAKETLEIIKKEIGQNDLLTIESPALNERNYGDYAGKNKWDAQKQLGDDEFKKLRRSWDYPIKNGESLKQVYERIVPYFLTTILPYLKTNKNVIVSSSGNALRALVKYLENISDSQIGSLEIGTGEAYVYTFDQNGTITNKEIRMENKNRV